ncbi:MAG: hypothetical protein JF627_03220 [Alphaproteobacteria bacterium]|nr:hypothetical protein [Alphaproteobacteria bacterium]
MTGRAKWLRPVLAAASLVYLLGCAAPAPQMEKGNEASRARISARLVQYRGQGAEIQAAMKADAQNGQLSQLLKDILADAELRGRSATVARYLAETDGKGAPAKPGVWLLSRVTDLLRATEETDRRAAILQPSLTASAMSETVIKQLVDLTGHRGWDKGTAEELLMIAGDVTVLSANVAADTDEQKRLEALQKLKAYADARSTGARAESTLR